MQPIGSVSHFPDQPRRNWHRKRAVIWASIFHRASPASGFPGRVKSESLRIKLSNSSEPKAARNTLYIYMCEFVHRSTYINRETPASHHTHLCEHSWAYIDTKCTGVVVNLLQNSWHEDSEKRLHFPACNTQDEEPNFAV